MNLHIWFPQLLLIALGAGLGYLLLGLRTDEPETPSAARRQTSRAGKLY